VNVMGLNTGIGGREFMGKEQGTLWARGKGPIFSVPTATTLMNQNLNL
jgi:hypothetical protein